MRVGVAVSNLESSQLNIGLINSANDVLSKSVENDISIFFEEPSLPCIQVLFSTMQFCEAWNFDGFVISTNLSCASKALALPSISRRLFYVWDLEWLRMKHKNFRTLHKIYANPNQILVARSTEHAKLISSCWNVPVPHIVEDCDMTKFIELLR